MSTKSLSNRFFFYFLALVLVTGAHADDGCTIQSAIAVDANTAVLVRTCSVEYSEVTSVALKDFRRDEEVVLRTLDEWDPVIVSGGDGQLVAWEEPKGPGDDTDGIRIFNFSDHELIGPLTLQRPDTLGDAPLRACLVNVASVLSGGAELAGTVESQTWPGHLDMVRELVVWSRATGEVLESYLLDGGFGWGTQVVDAAVPAGRFLVVCEHVRLESGREMRLYVFDRNAGTRVNFEPFWTGEISRLDNWPTVGPVLISNDGDYQYFYVLDPSAASVSWKLFGQVPDAKSHKSVRTGPWLVYLLSHDDGNQLVCYEIGEQSGFSHVKTLPTTATGLAPVPGAGKLLLWGPGDDIWQMDLKEPQQPSNPNISALRSR